MTDAEFNAFLRSNDTKVLLMELKVWDGAAEQTIYGSDRGYNTNMSPGVEHRVYPQIIKTVPSFRQSLRSGQRSLGEIVIDNTSGEHDNWITTYKFDGREVRFLIGSPSWLYADFQQVLIGVVESRSARRRDEIVLKLGDPELYLDQPIQTSLIDAGPNTGDFEPIAYGQINSAKAVLIDGPTHKYQVSDIAIDSFVAVKDNRVNVASYSGTIADGTFTLGAQPAGDITVSFKGAKVGGVLLEKAGEIINHIITTRTSLPSALYDAAAFTALDAAVSWKHNIYITESLTARQAINTLLDSIGAKLVRSRDGKISVARLRAPAVTADLAIDRDDVKFGMFKPVDIDPPWIRARLGYAKNYSVETDLATAITEAERAAAGRDFDVVTATNDIATAHPLAIEPDLIETTLTLEADATARLTELMTLHAVERFVYELVAYAITYRISVGETLSVTNPRFGFSGGVNGLVLSQDDSPTTGKSRIQIWL